VELPGHNALKYGKATYILKNSKLSAKGSTHVYHSATVGAVPELTVGAVPELEKKEKKKKKKFLFLSVYYLICRPSCRLIY